MFQRIGLIGKPGTTGGDSAIAGELRIIESILAARGIALFSDDHTIKLAGLTTARCANRAEMAEQTDLIIVVGGDGTLLSMARDSHLANARLCGVNRGRLGFLTDILPQNLEAQLGDILDGQFCEEERFLLNADIFRDGEKIASGTAFNDIVVHRTDVARMIELTTSVNDHFVNTHHADGVIVASPTGSTAYALSAGGPLLHPGLDAIALVPICPHTLSNRPIVVTSDSRIDIELTDPKEFEGQVTFDGHLKHPLRSGDRVRISRTEGKVRLIHPTDYDYFQILRAKLNWGLGRA